MPQNQLLRDSIQYCRNLCWQSGSSFYLPFWLLNQREFAAMCVLYSFFRISDDLVDDKKKSTNDKSIGLTLWRNNLTEIIQQQPISQPHPINPALTWLIKDLPLNPAWLLDSLNGAERDLFPMIIQTSADLDQYCYEVAGTVGLSCLSIWGTTTPQAQELGIICGRAFQRTNILRDLQEDYQRHRYYLPAADLKSQLMNSLEAKTFTPDLTQLLEHQMDITAQYYKTSQQLGRLIPSKGGRKMFHGIYNIYFELFQTLKKHPQKILQQRLSVSKSRKLCQTLYAALRY